MSSLSGRVKAMGALHYDAAVCNAKASYATRGVAKNSSKIVRSRYGHKTRPYLCSLCTRWHLSTVRDGD